MLNQTTMEEVPCPLCSSRSKRRLFADRDRGQVREGDFRVAECNACRFRFTIPRPSRETLADFYPEYYGPYQGFDGDGLALFDPRTSFCVRFKNQLKYSVLTKYYGYAPRRPPHPLNMPGHVPAWVGGMLERLAFSLFKHRNPRVPVCCGNRKALDVGCGNGIYLLFLKRLGWDVAGFDIANHVDPAVAAAGIPVFTGSLESLVSGRGAFDLISMWHVLEHLPDPVADLRRIRDLLCEGGTLLVEVPNSASAAAHLMRNHWYQWDLPRHLSHFTPDSLVRLLSEVGFRVQRLSHLPKTTLPQSLQSWVEKECGWERLKSFLRREGFSRVVRVLDLPLALARSSENIMATAVK